MFQSSSTCAACPGLSSAVSRPCASASASSAEPVSVVTECSAPSRHGSRGMAAPAAASAASGCATCTTPSASTNCAPSTSRAHSSNRIPMARLALDQTARLAGAVANRSDADSARSLRRTGAERSATPSMIELASRVSGISAGSITSRCASHSAASASAKAPRRRGEQPARRRAHRLAVEPHGTSCPSGAVEARS